MNDIVLQTISSSWRSAIDIGVATNNATGRENSKPWLNRQLKALENQGKIEKMKNRNRVFYRLCNPTQECNHEC